jgi:hypothetical protein
MHANANCSLLLTSVIVSKVLFNIATPAKLPFFGKLEGQFFWQGVEITKMDKRMYSLWNVVPRCSHTRNISILGIFPC